MQHSEGNRQKGEQGQNRPKNKQTEEGVDAGGCIVEIIKTFGTVFGSGIIVTILLHYLTGYSNAFIGMVGSLLTLGVGFAVIRGYIIVTVVPKLIWYLITFRFSKILDIGDEYSDSDDPDKKAGRKLGWAFLVSGILVYGIMSLFIDGSGNDRLIYLVVGLAHGGMYYWIFATKFFRLSEWE